MKEIKGEQKERIGRRKKESEEEIKNKKKEWSEVERKKMMMENKKKNEDEWREKKELKWAGNLFSKAKREKKQVLHIQHERVGVSTKCWVGGSLPCIHGQGWERGRKTAKGRAQWQVVGWWDSIIVRKFINHADSALVTYIRLPSPIPTTHQKSVPYHGQGDTQVHILENMHIRIYCIIVVFGLASKFRRLIICKLWICIYPAPPLRA